MRGAVSIELRLYPVDRWRGGIEGTCHTILNAPQNYDLFDDIRALSPDPLPAGHCFTGWIGDRLKDGPYEGEPVYGRLGSDSYGKPLTWLRAEELGVQLSKHFPSHPVTAFVRALSPDTMVVLDWH